MGLSFICKNDTHLAWFFFAFFNYFSVTQALLQVRFSLISTYVLVALHRERGDGY